MTTEQPTFNLLDIQGNKLKIEVEAGISNWLTYKEGTQNQRLKGWILRKKEGNEIILRVLSCKFQNWRGYPSPSNQERVLRVPSLHRASNVSFTCI